MINVYELLIIQLNTVYYLDTINTICHPMGSKGRLVMPLWLVNRLIQANYIISDSFLSISKCLYIAGRS